MTRVSITIEVNTDPVPGELYDPEDWRRYFDHHCQEHFPWYTPEIVDFKVLDTPRATEES